MSKISEFAEGLARPAAEALGLELWDVEYVREAGQWFLRVYIDKAGGGVSINDCEALSKALDPLLDEAEEMFPDNYVFEVSSAGAERELKRPGDYERFIGSSVEVRLYRAVDGVKTFTGTLTGYGEDGVRLDCAGKEYVFDKSQVAKTRLRIL